MYQKHRTEEFTVDVSASIVADDCAPTAENMDKHMRLEIISNSIIEFIFRFTCMHIRTLMSFKIIYLKP